MAKLLPGHVVGRTFSVWSRTLPQLLVIAAVVHVPLLALKWWLHDGIDGGADGTDATHGASWRATVARFLPAFTMLVFGPIVEGLAVLAVVQRLSGETPDVLRSIGLGLRRIGTTLAISGISAVGLFLMPMAGIFIALAGNRGGRSDLGGAEYVIFAIVLGWFVYLLVFCTAIPAALVEGLGAFRAFGRSRRLTSGARVRVFGTWLLFALACLIPTRMLGHFAKEFHDPTEALLAGAAVDWLIASLTCVLPIVLYHGLREVKDGTGIEELLQVFE